MSRGSLPGGWPGLRRRLAGRRVLVLLDFDGTLAPLADKPSRASLPARTRAILRRLAQHPSARVAVLSGRPLTWVRRAVGLPGVFYGGNHGLEIRGPGVSFAQPQARRLRPGLRALAAEARRAVRGVTGAWVEDKGLTVSVHYRGVPRRRRGVFFSALRALRRRTDGLPIRWRRGRMVREAVPDVPWHKGEAALFMVRRFPGTLPFALGDDRTDEDMFAALRDRGITVRVGRARSHARWRVGRQERVAPLLESVLRTLDEGPWA